MRSPAFLRSGEMVFPEVGVAAEEDADARRGFLKASSGWRREE